MAKKKKGGKRVQRDDGNANAPKRPRLALTVTPPQEEEAEVAAPEAESWYFKCDVCGLYGDNFDDGEHAMACECCGTWQHSKCHGLTPEEAEDDGYKFLCERCRGGAQSGGGGEEKNEEKNSGEEKCENCGNPLSSKDRPNGRVGPKGRICQPCYDRYRRYKNDRDWRTKHTVWDRTCSDCGRHNGDDWEGMLCGHCSHRRHVGAPDTRPNNSKLHLQNLEAHSHAVLRDLAYRQFRQTRPVDPFLQERPRPAVGDNYWHDASTTLIGAAAERGLVQRAATQKSKRHTLTKPEVINALQLDDAWNGVLPRPDPSSASDLHTLDARELLRQANHAGYRLAYGHQCQDSNKAITFLQGKRDATDALRKINPEKAASIREAVTNVAQRLRGQASAPPTHQSHNVGIVGSESALSRLFITLSHGHMPVWTSSVGYQCGPIALANSLRAVRENYNNNIPAEARQQLQHWTQEQLRQLLFVNWAEAGAVDGDGNPVEGIATPAYDVYLTEHINRAESGEAQEDEREHMLRLNDMDFQQLVAMIVLLHRAGDIHEQYHVGVVTDARYGAPANAQILHEGEEGAATIWLHHNLAAGGGDYNHWEGFEPPTNQTDYDIVVGWGLAADPASADMPRRNWQHQDPTATESRMSRLAREARNANSYLNREIAAEGRACNQCKSKDRAIYCKRTRGHIYCDACEDDGEWQDCKWPEGSVESRRTGWKTADTLDEEDLKPWERPLGAIEEEETLIRTLKGVLSDVPKKPHFLGIPCGRNSSHPGAMGMLELRQSLIMTGNAYNNMLDDPYYPSFPRPGGPGTPMRTHINAMARHGAEKVPIAHGNVQDPVAHALVNLFDDLLDPNNIHRLPIEIHFILAGLAGLSVDITGWGDFVQGFYGKVVDRDQQNTNNGNPTDIAGSIYIVAVMELHVTAQGSPSSINAGNAPHGVQRNNKQVVKYSMRHLMERHRDLMNHANSLNNGQGMPWAQYMSNMLLLHQGNAPAAFAILPNFPVWPHGAQEAEELDRMLMAMWGEMAWRSGWLNNTTSIPSEAHVRTRNDNRNNPMQ